MSSWSSRVGRLLFNLWPLDRRLRRWIERQMKRQDTECAEAAVGNDLRLRIDSFGMIAEMIVSDGRELSAQQQGRGKSR